MSVVENKEQETLEFVRDTISQIGSTRADLIPILQTITNKFGYISQVAIREVAALLKLPTKEISSVATFYRM